MVDAHLHLFQRTALNIIHIRVNTFRNLETGYEKSSRFYHVALRAEKSTIWACNIPVLDSTNSKVCVENNNLFNQVHLYDSMSLLDVL